MADLPLITSSDWAVLALPCVHDHIEVWERWVRRIAYSVKLQVDPKLEVDDLIGYGWEALLRSKERYDPLRDVNFDAYAFKPVRGAILDGVAKMSRSGRKARRIATLRLSPAEGEEGRTVLDVNELMWRHTFRFIAFDTSSPSSQPDGASPMIDPVSEDQGDGPAVEERAAHAHAWAKLRPTIARLPDVERELLEGYYFRGEGLGKVGERQGLQKYEATRVHNRALAKLRAALVANDRSEPDANLCPPAAPTKR